MKKVNSLIAPIISNLGMEEAVKLGHLRAKWSDIFERPVLLHISPASYREGELLINVDSPIWMQQLGFYKEDITKKLSGFGVNRVRFRLGKVFRLGKSESFSEKKQLTADDLSYINDIVSSVRDEELRNSIKKAMERSLIHKKLK